MSKCSDNIAPRRRTQSRRCDRGPKPCTTPDPPRPWGALQDRGSSPGHARRLQTPPNLPCAHDSAPRGTRPEQTPHPGSRVRSAQTPHAPPASRHHAASLCHKRHRSGQRPFLCSPARAARALRVIPNAAPFSRPRGPDKTTWHKTFAALRGPRNAHRPGALPCAPCRPEPPETVPCPRNMALRTG